MWVSKQERDEKLGVDSPIPTQGVSNEEFIPRPQTEDQKRWELLIGEMGSRHLGHRLSLVGFPAVGDRGLQALPDFR